MRIRTGLALVEVCALRVLLFDLEYFHHQAQWLYYCVIVLLVILIIKLSGCIIMSLFVLVVTDDDVLTATYQLHLVVTVI